MGEVKRGAAQKAADGRYEAKRAGMARLPGGYLTQEEAELLDELAAIEAEIVEEVDALKAILAEQQ